MDTKNSYKESKQYLAYCKHTDEKQKLLEHIDLAFQTLPQRILDLGCGNGVNTMFLAERFPKARIDALERSPAQYTYAHQYHARTNIRYILQPFEQFNTQTKYDFILASHVLQYIDSDLEQFVKKASKMLAPDGELWFVQQTKQGMAQIIKHQKPYLLNPRFKEWKTFEDYVPKIREIFTDECLFSITEEHLNSSFTAINFSCPSKEDKLRLEFIFCLENSFDQQSPEFKAHLSELSLSKNGRIIHPNQILKIRRRK